MTNYKHIFILSLFVVCGCGTYWDNPEKETKPVASQPFCGNAPIIHDSKGKELFKQNCASCHCISRGAMDCNQLEGILDRVPSKDWVFKFIRNSDSVIKSGDAYANAVKAKYKSEMPAFSSLTNEDIEDLLKYIDRGY